ARHATAPASTTARFLHEVLRVLDRESAIAPRFPAGDRLLGRRRGHGALVSRARLLAGPSHARCAEDGIGVMSAYFARPEANTRQRGWSPRTVDLPVDSDRGTCDLGGENTSDLFSVRTQDVAPPDKGTEPVMPK